MLIWVFSFTFTACDNGNENNTCTHDAGFWHTILLATCTENGTKELRCTICDFVLDSEIITALNKDGGHTWGEWQETTAPSSIANGIKNNTCVTCNISEIRDILATSYFQLIDENTYRIIRADVTPPNVVYIPSEFNGLPVIEIGRTSENWTSPLNNSSAFGGRNNIISVHIPDTVSSINSMAFRGCSSLTNITIPSSVTSIGSFVFRDCTSLTSIILPEGITSISGDMFYGCTNLTSIVIPSTVTSISNYAFVDCRSLTEITIPSGVISIGFMAFLRCYSLNNITIPASVTSIGSYAFENCTSLTNITFEGIGISFGISSFDGDLMIKYQEEGIGTYTRPIGGSVWTKQ